MVRFFRWIQDLLRELRRRQVIRVAVVYAGISFVILQLGEIWVEPFDLPDWVLQWTTFVLVLGFPVVITLAWVYNLTEEGVVREREGDVRGRAEGPEDETPPEVVVSRASLLSTAVIIFLLTLALSGAWWFSRDDTAGKDEPLEEVKSEVAERGLSGRERVADKSPELNPADIAVLYFDDNSPGDTLSALVDGLTEHLIHRLTQVSDLDVRSRHAVKPFRDGSVPLDSLVQRLRVGSLVEGSIRKSDGELVVTVQLIDGQTQSHLLSEVVRRPAGEIFSLQDSVAQKVSRLLRERLGKQIQLESWQADTDYPRAWRLVQRSDRLLEDAEQLKQDGDHKTASVLSSQADSLLSEAQSVDPNWATPVLLRARLAEIRLPPLYAQTRWGEREHRILNDGIKRVEEALNRDPSNAEALRLRGRLQFLLSQQVESTNRSSQLVDKAEKNLRAAVRKNPGSARAWYALSELMHLGRADFQQARYYAKRAREADAYLRLPTDIEYQFFYTAINEGNFDEAFHWCQQGQNRYPHHVRFWNCELVLLATEGAAESNINRAWTLLDKMRTNANPENRERFEALAYPKIAAVLIRADRPDSARAVLDRARDEGLTPESYPFVAYQQAHTHILFGNEEKALDLLAWFLDRARHVAQVVANDIWFEKLRGHPRFEKLVGRK